jgi:F-type H+-transporting ATPase subunit b
VHSAPLAAGASLLVPAPSDLLWGTVSFVVILVLFIWKVLPRLNALLDARSAAIEGKVNEADETQRAAEATLQRYNDQLAEARSEGGRIREQAREDGKRIIAELREQAQAEAARITAQGHAQIEADRASAAQSLRQDVGSLALQLASNIVGEHLNDDANATRLVDRFLADLDVDRATGSRT